MENKEITAAQISASSQYDGSHAPNQEDCILRVAKEHGPQARIILISGFKSSFVLRQMSLLWQPKEDSVALGNG